MRSKKNAPRAIIAASVSLGNGLLVVYLRDLFIDLMDADAAQYAALSMEMLQSGHWLQIHYRHLDYLDKPPLLLHRDWRSLWQPRWLVGLAVTALILLPMCWGLYQQFDLHPGKLVNGRIGVSGLIF